MEKQNLSETIIEQVIKNRRYEYIKEENIWKELQIEEEKFKSMKKPDYFVKTKNGNLFIEVKEFQKEGPLDKISGNLGTENGISSGYGSFVTEEMTHPFEEPLRKAAHKFEQYKKYKLPGVVIFINCHNIGIDDHPLMLNQLLFGNFAFAIPIKGKHSQLVRTTNGILRKDHYTQISAVGTLNYYYSSDTLDHSNTFDPNAYGFNIIKNQFAEFLLPDDIFSHNLDRVFESNDIEKMRNY